VDPRNVGAINVLANINAEKNAAGQPTTPFGQVISTSGANGTPENIKMLLEAAMQSSTIFSVLCPMIGPDANLYTVLLHAVQGDATAINKINSAANVLTGGRFESVKPANVAPLLPRAEYLPMAVYRELNGGRLADASQQIDLLAALNLYGADDLAQLGKFTRLASEQTDAVAHQALRQTLVESVLGQETKIKGLSVLATWNPAWLAAFASCVPANLLEPENPAALQTSLGLGMAGWAPSNAVGFISGGAAFSQDSRGAPVATHTGLGLSLVG
jgi:hypothetical protein